MIFKDDNQAIEYIKKNLEVSKEFKIMRENSKELRALVNGENFIDELICKIEGIESETKAKAREKYSRDIQDLFERLFQPISNIYYASGGVKEYDVKVEATKKEYLSKIANIRDGKPLSEWVQDFAISLLNTDPNGVLFLEYKTNPNLDVYPTYKSIDSIRNYEEKGQTIEWILFEPKTKDEKTYWRIVDDLTDRTFIQNGKEFILSEEKTFKHLFGSVPALICSNIVVPGSRVRKSSIHKLIGLAKEIARDQSFLTLYKIYKGNPIFWKYVQYCADCSGTGTSGETTCTKCNGKGIVTSKSDVTDVVTLPLPEDKDAPIITPNIAGYISPDLDVWKKFEETLELNEKIIYKTHWGTNYGYQDVNGIKTATEVNADKQPLENRLNKYADFAEYIEWKFSEWILNLYDLAKPRNESKTTINLGRRYIVESYDAILERYEKSRLAGENSVVLDKLFSEYLGAKYRNNPIDLQINLVKSKVEPYLHLPVSQVQSIFGNIEVQRKVLFQNYWQKITDFKQTPEFYIEDYKKWFELNKIEIEPKTIIN